MNVNLTPQLENMVRQKVASGLYNSASEVIREALRVMDTQEQIQVIKLEQLRKDIIDGLESGESEIWNLEEIKQSARQYRAEKNKA
jgi:antitoxin ParD1/3/4